MHYVTNVDLSYAIRRLMEASQQNLPPSVQQNVRPTASLRAKLGPKAQDPKSRLQKSMERVNPQLRKNINQNREASNARLAAKQGTYKSPQVKKSKLINQAKEVIGRARTDQKTLTAKGRSEWDAFKADPAVQQAKEKITSHPLYKRAKGVVDYARNLHPDVKKTIAVGAIGAYGAYRVGKSIRRGMRRRRAERMYYMRQAAMNRSQNPYSWAEDVDTQVWARAIIEEAKEKKENWLVRKSKEQLKSGVDALKREVNKPTRNTKMAIKHYLRGRQNVRRGNPHGKVQIARAKTVLKNRAPVIAAAGIGGAV
jgi:hypothetical protein